MIITIKVCPLNENPLELYKKQWIRGLHHRYYRLRNLIYRLRSLYIYD